MVYLLVYIADQSVMVYLLVYLADQSVIVYVGVPC